MLDIIINFDISVMLILQSIPIIYHNMKIY